MIVPTLCVGMPHRTLCVRFWDAERPGLHSHAERGNDQQSINNRSTIDQQSINNEVFAPFDLLYR
jgi:hypothetical protein